MNVTLDHAMINAFSAALVERPAIMRPYFDENIASQNLIKRIEKDFSEADASHEEWKHEGRQRQEALVKIYEELPFEKRHLDMLLTMAEAVEHQCEGFAKENHRLKNILRTQFKELETVGFRYLSEFEACLRGNEQRMDDEIEYRLGFALFLRALRSKYELDNETGVIISSAKGLDAYFAQFSV